jgi:pentatricopeptide repeat protein
MLVHSSRLLISGSECTSLLLSAENGLDMEVAVWDSIVGFYAKCGRLQYARELFEGMPKKDAVNYSAMNVRYMNHGHVDKGMELVEVILRHFHRSRYRSRPLWFFYGECL